MSYYPNEKGGSSQFRKFRRASLALSAALIVQSFAAGGGGGGGSTSELTGLDAFGRTRDLHYVSPAGVPGSPGIPAGGTLHRYEYNYDLSGNRTHARVYQQPAIFWTDSPVPPGTSPLLHDDDRSAKYVYDGLQRLIAADLGEPDAAGDILNPLRSADWSLDNLGNWTGIEDGAGVPPADVPGLTIVQAPPPTAPSGTAPTVTSVDHAVGLDNSLQSVTREISVGGNPASSPTTNDYLVNLAGNTVLDGAYFYQYDAWNRLVEVRLKGSLDASDFDDVGRYRPCPINTGNPPGTPGDWLVRYVYDGLGRLVEKTTPVFGGQNETRREEYHYDGVRRIQELVRREIAVVVVPGGEGGEPNPEGEPGDPVPSGGLGLEEPAEVLPGEPLVPVEVVTALPAGWDQREYVWGPEYVDELAWQVDKDGKPYYALLDANYNVMAIVAGANVPPSSGDPAGTPTIPAGAVVEQYVWSPYGELLSRDVFDRRVNADGSPTPTTGKLVTDAGAARPANGSDPGSPGTAGASLPGIRNKVGHQGLFFERFDGLNTDPALVPTDATAVTATAPAGRGKGFYYNRWRWYDAQAGRFVSEDMNGAGMAGSQSLAYHGEAFAISVDSYSGTTQFGDGLNLFAYLASSPLMGTDAAGLEAWWDEDIDEAISDRAGHAMYALGTLNEGARMVSVGLKTTLDIARGFLPGSGLYDAFNAVQVLASGQGGFWEALDIAMAAIPVVKGAMTGFRALSKAAGWGRKACNSFVAGTLIATPFGQIPIEHLRPGDWVVSRYEVDQGGALVVRRVSETIVGQAEQILWITLADGVSIGLTQQHEVWVAGRGGIPACELVVGDALLRADGAGAQIVDLVLDEASTPVFNLEVGGTATFFAEGAWVHNNSCTVAAKAWAQFLDRRGTYSEMQKLTAGHKHEIEAHHILEVRHAKKWGITNTDSLPAVILTKAEHQQLTGRLFSELPTTGARRFSQEEVWAAYQRVYAGYPEC